ncbi:MAG: phosphatidylserine/phosphatidylglycerophosphate/cardiolipin synthase family protein [Bacteroidia bacterium]|nr:phosphatidylserine/phosphatidylglycerophosphate/cardiolipin synthase family protein [Bacteroidia bacterium]
MKEDDSIRFFKPGAAFFDALISAISEAEHYIHFQIYIFENDATGKRVSEALRQAAKRGVKVYMVLDAYGSGGIGARLVKEWKSDGIRVRFFAPLFGRKGFGIRRRLHHKIITVDGRIAFTGGMNIGDRYSGYGGGDIWMDHMILLKGIAVHELERICTLYWDRKTRKLILPLLTGSSMRGGITVLRNDRVRGKAEVAAAYKELLGSSRKSVFLIASYFLPGSSFRKALRSAALRGVEVTLLLPGKSDVGLAEAAMRHLYPWLIRYGIRIVEWKDTVLHAKWMSVDGTTVLFGSFNLNHLSDFSSIETNVRIENPSFVSSSENYFRNSVLPRCQTISPVIVTQHRTLYQRLKYRLAYMITRFLFRFMYRVTSRE